MKTPGAIVNNQTEQNSADVTTLLRQQLNVVRHPFGVVNNMLTDIEFNKRLIKEGMTKIRWEFSLHHRVQNGSGTHPASYPTGTGGSFPGDEAAGA
jgi:hypothetical protein